MKDKTRLRHSGAEPHPLVHTVNPPIQRGSTVLLPTGASLYDGSQVGYGRAGLSAQNALCEALADMEGAAGVRLYPSGLASVTGPMLALLKSGDEVLVCQHVYRPTRMFCDNLLTRYGVKVRYYPQTLPADALMAMTTKRTRMIVLEFARLSHLRDAGRARHRPAGAHPGHSDPDGQHLGGRLAVQAAGARRGRLRPGPDQVCGRPFGRVHGLRRRARRSPAYKARRRDARGGLVGLARGRLSDAAQPADARHPPGTPWQERPASC